MKILLVIIVFDMATTFYQDEPMTPHKHTEESTTDILEEIDELKKKLKIELRHMKVIENTRFYEDTTNDKSLVTPINELLPIHTTRKNNPIKKTKVNVKQLISHINRERMELDRTGENPYDRSAEIDFTPVKYVDHTRTKVKNRADDYQLRPISDKSVRTFRFNGKKYRVRKTKRNRNIHLKPIDRFYRREFKVGVDLEDKPIYWAHCHDLITPFLKGFDTIASTGMRFFTPRSITVQRFIQLMSINTTGYTKEDIEAILYQISDMRLYFFRWDSDSMRLMLDLLFQKKPPTFLALKMEIQKWLYVKWRLNISDVDNLLQNARLFRPPCIIGPHSLGSTDAGRMSTYPKVTHSVTCRSTTPIDGSTVNIPKDSFKKRSSDNVTQTRFKSAEKQKRIEKPKYYRQNNRHKINNDHRGRENKQNRNKNAGVETVSKKYNNKMYGMKMQMQMEKSKERLKDDEEGDDFEGGLDIELTETDVLEEEELEEDDMGDSREKGRDKHN